MSTQKYPDSNTSVAGEDLDKQVVPTVPSSNASTPNSSIAGSPNGESFIIPMMHDRENHVASEPDNIAQEYDRYYMQNGAEPSLYNRRFEGDRVLPRERELVSNAVTNIANSFPPATEAEPLRLRVVDFGSGDGRLFPIFHELAQTKLKAKNIHLELIAVEPSLEGVKIFQNNLLQYGFPPPVENKLHPITTTSGKNNGYEAAVMEKDNLSVRFIHSHVEDKLSHTASLIGDDIHLSLAMFGVLAHVPTRAARHEYVKMFYDKTVPGGGTLITVPTPRRFVEEQKSYSMMMRHKTPVGSAKERRDFYYCKFEGDGPEENLAVKNYYHAFTTKELAKLVALVKDSTERQSASGFVLLDNTIHAVYNEPDEVAGQPRRPFTQSEAEAELTKALTETYGTRDHMTKRVKPISKEREALRIHHHCDYIAAFAKKEDHGTAARR